MWPASSLHGDAAPEGRRLLRRGSEWGPHGQKNLEVLLFIIYEIQILLY